jgi:diadenosine tetraphosphate (Ap4A) HIT family hydrolase
VPIELPQGPCLFCERIAGDRTHPWAVIDEDDLTIVVINPRQYEEGQAMILPRRHAATVLDLTDEEAGALMRQVQRVGRAMVAAFDPDGITIFQNNGVASFQQVPHVHMHVVPRRYDGGWGEGPPHLAKITRAEQDERFRKDALPMERLTELAERVRAHLA